MCLKTAEVVKTARIGYRGFLAQVGGVPHWDEGLGCGFEDTEDDNIRGLWQRMQTEVDQGQVLPWHKVHLYLYSYLYLYVYF